MRQSHAAAHIVLASVIVIILTSIPYVFGISITPPGWHFVGFTYNSDDACVYLSWIKQARDGNFFIRNLYTAEPQKNLPFNLLFLAMGGTSRLVGCSAAASFHTFRVLLIPALLFAIWKLCKTLGKEDAAILIVWIAGLSSGLGWLIKIGSSINRPIDLWQPEAITFLSAYLNPLFLAGTILMVTSLNCIFIAINRCDTKYAIFAGIALLVLGNIHTYDLVPVWLAFVFYVLIISIIHKNRLIWFRAAKYGIIAFFIALPTAGYQVFLLLTEPVYAMRAATLAETPALHFILIGYGLVFVFACAGVFQAIKRREEYCWFAVAWIVAGFAAAYLPIEQQRKLLMGTHIPLSILAGVYLKPLLGSIKGLRTTYAAILLVVLLMPSNILFIRRDIERLKENNTAPGLQAIISADGMKLIQWLKKNTKNDDLVLAPPNVATFLPAIAGCRVYYGHWSETANFKEKLNQWFDFAGIDSSDTFRKQFIRKSNVTIIVQNLSILQFGKHFTGGPLPPDIGKEVYRAGNYAVYKVNHP